MLPKDLKDPISQSQENPFQFLGGGGLVLSDMIVAESEFDEDSFKPPTLQTTAFPSLDTKVFLGKKTEESEEDGVDEETDQKMDVVDLTVEHMRLEKLKWTKPIDSSESEETSKIPTLRFDFEGNIITQESQKGGDFSNEYFHHSDEPNKAGYTLHEILTYVSSSVAAQVQMFLEMLHKVVSVQIRRDVQFFLDNIYAKFESLHTLKLVNRVLLLNLKKRLLVECIVNIYHSLYCSKFSSFFTQEAISNYYHADFYIPFLHHPKFTLPNERQEFNEFVQTCLTSLIPMYASTWLSNTPDNDNDNGCGGVLEKVFQVCERGVRELKPRHVVALYTIAPKRTMRLMCVLFAAWNCNVPFESNSEWKQLRYKTLPRDVLRFLASEKGVGSSLGWAHVANFAFQNQMGGESGKVVGCLLRLLTQMETMSASEVCENVVSILCGFLCVGEEVDEKTGDQIVNFFLEERETGVFSGDVNRLTVLLLRLLSTCLKGRKRNQKLIDRLFPENVKSMLVKMYRQSVDYLTNITFEFDGGSSSIFSKFDFLIVDPVWISSNFDSLERVLQCVSVLKSFIALQAHFAIDRMLYESAGTLFLRLCAESGLYDTLGDNKLRKCVVCAITELGEDLLRTSIVHKTNLDVQLYVLYGSLKCRGSALLNELLGSVLGGGYTQNEELKTMVREYLLRRENSLGAAWYFFLIENRYLRRISALSQQLLINSLKFVNRVEQRAVLYVKTIPFYIRFINIMKIFLFDEIALWKGNKEIESALVEYAQFYLSTHFGREIDILMPSTGSVNAIEREKESGLLCEFIESFLKQYVGESYANPIFSIFVLLLLGTQWGYRVNTLVLKHTRERLPMFFREMTTSYPRIVKLFNEKNVKRGTKGERKERMKFLEMVIFEVFRDERTTRECKKVNPFVYEYFWAELKEFRIQKPGQFKMYFFGNLNEMLRKDFE